MGGNQKSNWAISPGRYVVREAGSGGRYIGRSTATLALNTVNPRVHPTRSAITVAGIRGWSASSARIASSYPSAADPVGTLSNFGGPGEANALRTVSLVTPIRARSPRSTTPPRHATDGSLPSPAH